MENKTLKNFLNKLLEIENGKDIIQILLSNAEFLRIESLRKLLNILRDIKKENNEKKFIKLSNILITIIKEKEDFIREIKPPEEPKDWAGYFRRYLALRNKEDLEKAKALAEGEILELIEAYKQKEFEKIENSEPSLHKKLLVDDRKREADTVVLLYEKLLAEDRKEEAYTVVLLSLDEITRLVEEFKQFPPAKQMKALETGMKACHKACELSGEIKDFPCYVFYLSVAARGYYENRNLEEAKRYYMTALKIQRKLAEEQPHIYLPNVAMTLNNLGAVLRDQHLFPEAEENFKEALKYYRKLAEEQPHIYLPNVAMTLHNLGAVLRDQRLFPEAEKSLQEALKYYGKLAEEQPHITLNNLGNVFWEQRRFPEAEKNYKEALKKYRKLAEEQPHIYLPNVAMTLNNLGAVQQDQRRFSQAEKSLQEALEIRRKLAKQQPHIYLPYVAATLNNLGTVLSEQCRFPQAEKAYKEAIRLYQKYNIPNELLSSLSNLADLYLKQNLNEKAAKTLKEAIKQVEVLHTEVFDLDRRIQIMRENIHIFENLTVALMELGQYEEAIEITENGKGRTLKDLLALRELMPNAPEEIVNDYKSMLFKVRTLYEQIERARRGELIEVRGKERLTPQQLSEIIEELQSERLDALMKINEIVKKIIEYDPDFLLYAQPLTKRDIFQIAEKANSVLLLFSVTNKGTYAFLVFPNKSYDVVKIAKFTTKALSNFLLEFDEKKKMPKGGWVFYYNFFAPFKSTSRLWFKFLDEALEKLYRMLFKQIHKKLKKRSDIKKLIIVPSKGLSILPLHAIWWNENGKRRYLMDEYIISYAPSLNIYQRCLEREGERSLGNALLVSNPTEELIHSEWECEKIEELLGKKRTNVLWRSEGIKEKVLQLSSEKSILHFSCHGEYKPGNPMNSALMLAAGQNNGKKEKEENENKEPFTLGEIMEKLHIPQSWLVVLSACETGLVDFREIADEHFGLQIGFLYAGAPTVYATLWRVNQFTTALLMIKAYENLKKRFNKVEALQEAQRWLKGLKPKEILDLIEPWEEKMKKKYPKEWKDFVPDLQKLQSLAEKNPNCTPLEHPIFWAGFQVVGV